MRNKKLVSTVAAATMVASTMAMPVMAVDSTTESGHVDVNLETKTAVIRVVVPTSMVAAVNQFEVGDPGSQIYSDDFIMDNKSEIPVKVSVTSTATIKSGNKLLGTKEEAASSENAGEAWVAVAAQTSDGKYIEDSGATIADLDDTSANVTTFTDKGTDAAPALQTDQTFYLDKSSATGYKLLNAGEDASEIEYAEFHELTPITFSGSDDTAKGAELAKVLAKNDVYHVATASVDDGAALTKVAKGGTATYSSSNTYYTADSEVVAKASVDVAKLYMYGDDENSTTAAKGKAAFRYIGKLSDGQETWTKDDISKINVSYAITGVKESTYDKIDTAGALTYGLYKVSLTEITGTKLAKGDGTAITGATAIATRLKGTAATQFQFDVSQIDLAGLEVTKIIIDSNEYEFTASANTASTAATVSDGKLYTIKNFTASTVAKIQFYYGDASGDRYIVTWTIS